MISYRIFTIRVVLCSSSFFICSLLAGQAYDSCLNSINRQANVAELFAAFKTINNCITEKNQKIGSVSNSYSDGQEFKLKIIKTDILDTLVLFSMDSILLPDTVIVFLFRYTARIERWSKSDKFMFYALNGGNPSDLYSPKKVIIRQSENAAKLMIPYSWSFEDKRFNRMAFYDEILIK
jgi:hypothetical protein